MFVALFSVDMFTGFNMVMVKPFWLRRCHLEDVNLHDWIGYFNTKIAVKHFVDLKLVMQVNIAKMKLLIICFEHLSIGFITSQ